jgi:predicted phosphodiesterase
VRIVVLADTHIPDFARALPNSLVPALRKADLILHAGDVTSRTVLDELST